MSGRLSRLWAKKPGRTVTISMAGEPPHPFTGSCPIREHTGDGYYVGRCWHATYNGICPRHGALEDYPTHDDREVPPGDRRWSTEADDVDG